MESLESLDPISQQKRTWTTWSFASLWASIVINPFAYISGAAMLSLGLNWWQIIIVNAIGSAILLVALMLNAMPGVKYGISFPVLCRCSFGIRGAQIAALSRGLIAIGWLSLNLWVGAKGLHTAFQNIGNDISGPNMDKDLTTGQFVTFVLYAGAHALIVYLGVEKIRKLLQFAAPIQALGLTALVIWALVKVPLHESLDKSSELEPANSKEPFWLAFVSAIVSCVAGWSTMTLNIADLSRYASSQRAQVVGQAAGFPLLNTLVPFFGVVVSSSARILYGDADFFDLVTLFGYWKPGAGIIAALILSVAVATTNIMANMVSSSNDFAHLNPKRITFRMGAFMSLIIAVAIVPWRIAADGSAFVSFLVSYAIVTGPIFAIMVVDYAMRKQHIDIDDLYSSSENSRYYYWKGFNIRAFIAIILSVALCIPGLYYSLDGAKYEGAARVWLALYGMSWFVAGAIAGISYYAMMKVFPPNQWDDSFPTQTTSPRQPLINLGDGDSNH